MNFLFVQLIGLIAWLILVFSYYRKNTDKILVFHIIACIFYCIHYFLLGAYSGLIICAFEAFFDFLYYKTDKDKYIYMVSVPIRIISGIWTFTLWIDILPILASLIDGYTLTMKKKNVVFWAIISYTLWVIYDLFVGSYSGAITSGILVLSNLSILLFNYNILKKGDVDPIKRSNIIKKDVK